MKGKIPISKKVTYLDYKTKLDCHIGRIIHLKEFGFTFPVHYTIGLVTYCDQYCKGCYAGGFRFNPNVIYTASLDVLKNVLDSPLFPMINHRLLNTKDGPYKVSVVIKLYLIVILQIKNKN